MCIGNPHYGSLLVTSNGLDRNGFDKWAFYPGMLFQSDDKWWGDRGRRKRSHEGLDICFYLGTDGEIRNLPPTANIPVMYEGTVVCLLDDYIGKTLFILHDIYDKNQNQLCSIYGHTKPCDTIRVSSVVRQGDIIAAICDAERKGVPMSSHLHLSLAWIPKSYEYQQLSWEKISRQTELILLDPIDFIEVNYTILPPDQRS
jgi:hypothetical protein